MQPNSINPEIPAKAKPLSHTSLPIYILSGGKSSRFGSDKALASIHGRPLIVHTAEQLRPFSEDLCVIAQSDGQYQHQSLQTIGDIYPALGPLGGLYTALKHAKEPGWFFLISCDLAGFQVEWVKQLSQYCHSPNQAVAFFTERWEPLFAFYHTSCLPLVERAIQDKRLAMWKLLERLETKALPHPEDWSQATQINTPKALEQHLQKTLPSL